MPKRMFADDEEVIIPKGHALSEKTGLRFFASSKQIQITWLGHASFLIRLGKITILTDPFLSKPLRYKFFERQKIPESSHPSSKITSD